MVFFDAQVAIEVFFLVSTQWRHSMEGISGLDYTAVLSVISCYKKKKKKRIALLKEVSAIEKGYLRKFSELTKKD